MRLFKPTYKDKKGKTQKVSKWWIELRDHNEIVRRFAGFVDKAATEEIGRHIQRLISFREANLPPDAQLVQWLELAPEKLCQKFAEIGLLQADRVAASRPLLEHIADFERTMRARTTEKHARQISSTLKRIAAGCKFEFWSDVKATDIELFIAELHLSRKTQVSLTKQAKNRYAKIFRQFARWMVKEKRATEIPNIHIQKVSEHFERAFEPDEFQHLLEVTRQGPVRYGMTGYERWLVYILAVETGLRRGELRSLTPASFDFNSRTVFVKGDDTKNHNDAEQRISETTAALFKEYTANKMPNVKLFDIPQYSADMIEEDCETAGIEVVNNRGKIKFHSLRHTCGTFLADKGVHPKVIQEIMRHKDINLTMSRYTHTLKGQVAAAINSLPDFTKHRATGTE